MEQKRVGIAELKKVFLGDFFDYLKTGMGIENADTLFHSEVVAGVLFHILYSKYHQAKQQEEKLAGAVQQKEKLIEGLKKGLTQEKLDAFVKEVKVNIEDKAKRQTEVAAMAVKTKLQSEARQEVQRKCVHKFDLNEVCTVCGSTVTQIQELKVADFNKAKEGKSVN